MPTQIKPRGNGRASHHQDAEHSIGPDCASLRFTVRLDPIHCEETHREADRDDPSAAAWRIWKVLKSPGEET